MLKCGTAGDRINNNTVGVRTQKGPRVLTTAPNSFINTLMLHVSCKFDLFNETDEGKNVL